MRVVSIKNWELLSRLSALVAFDFVILIIWAGASPITIESSDNPVCDSKSNADFVGILIASKVRCALARCAELKVPPSPDLLDSQGVMLAIGAWLTYQVRNVHSMYNESVYIGISM